MVNQPEMAESSPRSETFQRNGNNSHDSEIESEVNNDSAKVKQYSQENEVRYEIPSAFLCSINETREPEKMTSSELDKLLSKFLKDVKK